MYFWGMYLFSACEVLDEKNSKTPVDMDEDGFLSDLDCDDSDPNIFPDAVEICNEKDDNCNGLIDDSDPALDITTTQIFFLDEDEDGHGAEERQRCFLSRGYAEVDGDCDNQNAAVYPIETLLPHVMTVSLHHHRS